MKKIIMILMSLILICSAVSACQKANTDSKINMQESAEGQNAAEKITASENNGRLSIVTTIFPQYDFARQIVGDKADLYMLLKPGAESHSYEPTPQDIKTIQNSNLFIYTGGENDTWVEGILDSMGEDAPETMRLIDLVDTLEEEIVEGMEHDHDHEEIDEHSDDHEAADEHEHADEHTESDEHDHAYHHELDEHVWTSPVKAEEIVKQLTEKIMTLDSANADFYQQNSKQYLAELENLDKAFKDVVDHAERKTILVADRFPFRYLAEEYGLDYYAAFSGCSTDTEASAATVAFLIDKTNELKLPVVFSIELSNEKIADSVVESTEAKKLTLHSVHNLSVEELAAGETYISLMRRNVENLKEALQS